MLTDPIFYAVLVMALFGCLVLAAVASGCDHRYETRWNGDADPPKFWNECMKCGKRKT